jgi:hypothetical protein
MISRYAFLRKPKSLIKQLRYWFLLRYPRRKLRLHLGCGNKSLPGFVNIDCNHTSATDFVCDAARLPCPDDSVECIESYHVIEHIPMPTTKSVLAEWMRVLAPSGRLVIECPDLEQAIREYIGGNRDRLFSIYGRQRFSGDTHYWGYDSVTLPKMLTEVGFSDIGLFPAQDYHVEKEPCLRAECTKH